MYTLFEDAMEIKETNKEVETTIETTPMKGTTTTSQQ